MILNAGSIVAPCMVVWWSPVKATTPAPHGLEVEQIQSNLMTLLAARQASRDRDSTRDVAAKMRPKPTIRGRRWVSASEIYTRQSKPPCSRKSARPGGILRARSNCAQLMERNEL